MSYISCIIVSIDINAPFYLEIKVFMGYISDEGTTNSSTKEILIKYKNIETFEKKSFKKMENKMAFSCHTPLNIDMCYKLIPQHG